MFSVLTSSDSRILYHIPPTKPDPALPCTPENFFTRKQVPRPEQKGPTCWYYALAILRPRIGKLPSAEFREARRIEAAISTLRKKCSAQAEEKSSLYVFFSVPELTCHEMLQLSESTHSLVFSRLHAFCKKHAKSLSNSCSKKTVKTFLAELKQKEFRKNIHDLLADVGISFQDIPMLCHAPKSCDIHKASMAILPLYLLRMYVSLWRPEQDAFCLIRALNQCGPMIVQGALGRVYYKTKPFVLGEIAGHSIQAFKAGTYKSRQAGHAVIVVGAKAFKSSKALVYYLDPADGGKQIYAISLRAFKARLCDVFGYLFVDQAEKARYSPFPYAWHTPFYPGIKDKVDLEVHYDAGFGNQLEVRGKGLGFSWDAGVPMTWTPGNLWRVSLPKGGDFEYKIVLKTPDATHWEVGENRNTKTSLFPLTPHFSH